MSSSYRLELDRWLKSLDVVADTVFDVGGAQLPLPKRVNSFDVDNYTIFDLPQPHADSPEPDVLCDLNEGLASAGINSAIHGYRGMADAVFCLEVMEYVYRPELALNTLKTLVKPKGYIWVSWQSVYPLHQPIADDALRYMPAGVQKLADICGLKITEWVWRRAETNGWLQFCSAERMRPAKGEDHSFTGFITKLEKR